jgi:hypothetical protein
MSTNGAQFATRCGDFLWNYSGGKYSINQFASVIRAYAPESLAAVLGTVTPFVSQTLMSDTACAIETKTGYSPMTCFAATVGVGYVGLKSLQWAYKRYSASNPLELLQAILEKHALNLLNVDYKNLATTIDSVFDGKAEAVLNEIKAKWPDAFNMMTEKMKQDVRAAAKAEEMKTFPALLEQKKDDIRQAVAESQVPGIKTQTKGITGLQESGANVAQFDLKSALSTIFYGAMPSVSQAPRLQLK